MEMRIGDKWLGRTPNGQTFYLASVRDVQFVRKVLDGGWKFLFVTMEEQIDEEFEIYGAVTSLEITDIEILEIKGRWKC